MSQFIDSYRLKGHNKALLEEVKKFLAIEKSKIVKKKEQSKVKQEVTIPVKPGKRPSKQANKPLPPPKPVVIGAVVRMKNGSQKGEVAELKGKDAVVLFGNFKTKVKVSDLEVVN